MVSSDFCRLSRKLLFQWLGQWSNQKSFKCLTLTRPSQQMLLTLGRVMVVKCWLDQKQFESIKQQTRFLNQCLMTTVLTNICFGGNCIRLKMSLKQFGNAAFFKNWKVIRLENVFGIPFFRSRSTNLRKLFSRKFGLGVSHQTFEPATKKIVTGQNFRPNRTTVVAWNGSCSLMIWVGGVGRLSKDRLDQKLLNYFSPRIQVWA